MRNIHSLMALCSVLPACIQYPESTTDQEVLDALEDCQSDLDTLSARVDALEGQTGDFVRAEDLEEYLTAESLEDYATLDDLTGYASEDELVALQESVDQLQVDLNLLSSEAVRMITSSTTINVTSEVDYNAAMDYLDNYRIGNGAVVTIQFPSSTTINFEGPMYVRHADGARIRILGGATVSDLTTLSFHRGSGLILENGQTLGYLDGFVFEGGLIINSIGVSLDEDAFAEFGPNVQVAEFYYGMLINRGSALYAESIQIHSNAAHGVEVSNGSVLWARYAQSFDNLSSGFVVGTGSAADLTFSSATGNTVNGYSTDTGGNIQASECDATNNGQDGVWAAGRSSLRIAGCTVSGNARYQVYATEGSSVIASYANLGSGTSVYTSLGGWIIGEGTVYSGLLRATAISDIDSAWFIQ